MNLKTIKRLNRHQYNLNVFSESKITQISKEELRDKMSCNGSRAENHLKILDFNILNEKITLKIRK